MKGIPCLWAERINVKMFTLLNSMYGFNVISNKFSVTFSTDTEKNSKILMDSQMTPTKAVLRTKLEASYLLISSYK